MISLQQALHLYSEIQPIKRLRSLPLELAYGYTLVRHLRSRLSLPPMRQSAMDGYAVRRMDIAAANAQSPVRLTLSQSIAAGQTPQPLRPGTAARIFTGAPMPAGADCVVIQENVTQQESHAVFTSCPSLGTHVREQGEEMAAGQVVLSKGQHLGSQSLSIAANAGHAHLPCRDKPRISIIVTGDELIAPGQARGPAEIYESNGSFLQHFVTQHDSDFYSLQRIGDDPELLQQAVAQALPQCDVLLISGGASVGEHDHSRQAVLNNGVNEVFWKVAQKPGKPLSFGRGPQGQLVFVLPGNPASVYVGAMVHVRTALHLLQGRRPPHCIKGALTRRVEADNQRERLVRISASMKNGMLQFTPLPRQASHMATNLAHTQGIARIPPGHTLSAGSLVSAWLIGDAAEL